MQQRLKLNADFGLALAAATRGTNCQRDDILAAALFFGLCCFGYTLFLALIDAAEPVRFLANIQGLMIVCMVLASAGGLLTLKDAFPRLATAFLPGRAAKLVMTWTGW